MPHTTPDHTLNASPRLLKRPFSRKVAVDETLLDEQALDPMAPGDVLLASRRLALTTNNNITYAAFVDPTASPGWTRQCPRFTPISPADKPALVDALYHGRLDPREGQAVVLA